MWKRKTSPEVIRREQLPDFGHIDANLRKGRNISEGYRRGVGIEFGDLRGLVARDPDFREAHALAEGRTLVSADRLTNLFLLMKFYLPQLPFGHVVEYGSYNGGSALFLASLAKTFTPGARVFALDTFAGMPSTDSAIDAHRGGDFVSQKASELDALRDRCGLDNLEFVEGRFEDTAASVMARAQHVRLTHIDCDIYEAVRFSYAATKPFTVPRGYFVFDDATTSTCLGAMEAIEECVIREDRLHAEQVFPHFVFRQPCEEG